jgi:peptidoglycan/LPS O-acetylase OafA/YrhL
MESVDWMMVLAHVRRKAKYWIRQKGQMIVLAGFCACYQVVPVAWQTAVPILQTRLAILAAGCFVLLAVHRRRRKQPLSLALFSLLQVPVASAHRWRGRNDSQRHSWENVGPAPGSSILEI